MGKRIRGIIEKRAIVFENITARGKLHFSFFPSFIQIVFLLANTNDFLHLKSTNYKYISCLVTKTATLQLQINLFKKKVAYLIKQNIRLGLHFLSFVCKLIARGV